MYVLQLLSVIVCDITATAADACHWFLSLSLRKGSLWPLLPGPPWVCTESRNSNLSPAEAEVLAEGAAASLQTKLNTVASRVVIQRRSGPWYNSQMRSLEQKVQRFEKKSYAPKTDNDHLAWQDILVTDEKALRKTGNDDVIEENQTDPRFLFSTLSKLTKSHSDLDPHVPSTPNSDKFVSFFMINVPNQEEVW